MNPLANFPNRNCQCHVECAEDKEFLSGMHTRYSFSTEIADGCSRHPMGKTPKKQLRINGAGVFVIYYDLLKTQKIMCYKVTNTVSTIDGNHKSTAKS